MAEPVESVDEFADVDPEVLERFRAAVERARDDFITFAKLMFPSPDEPYDPDRSTFKVGKHHAVIAKILTLVEAGAPGWDRLIITLPPRHGKTEMCGSLFLPWFVGRNPHLSTAYATYNDEFSGDIGRSVLDRMRFETYRMIFPKTELRKGSASASRIVTTKRGTMVFVGRGTSLTGRGFHVGLCDDLLKDAAEANSQAIRDACWEWFNKVFMTRQMEQGARVIIIITRWHEDDIVGRLTNKENPYYIKEEADSWKVLNLPAEALDNDPLKRRRGEPLWPERFGSEFLHAQRRRDPAAFEALYQQNPAPEEGVEFKKHFFTWYRDHERPPVEELRLYAASDHAVATKQVNDKTVILIGGLDKHGILWLIDCWWVRAPTLAQVNAMVDFMLQYSLQYWWADDDQIRQSIGPFLQQKKLEKGASCAMWTERFPGDKLKKAQSIHGLMSDGRVRFPRDKWWGNAAQTEMLKFPKGAHDDFVDAIAILGMKMTSMLRSDYKPGEEPPARDTWQWFKKEVRHQERLSQRLAAGVEDSW